jgi:hypothetical protein
MARQQRVGAGAGADREDQERSEGRLGDVQLRHALQVAQRAPAFGDELRHGGEVAGDQHQVGHAARHLRAAALGDRQARALHRGHVVDAIADHRHVAPLLGERLHDRPLALGRDTTDHADSGREPGQLDRIARHLIAAADAAQRYADVARDRRDGRRRVAREHLYLHPFAPQEGDCVLDPRPQLLRDPDQAERLQAGRRNLVRLGGKPGCRACEREHAPALRLQGVSVLGERVLEMEALGRAEVEALVRQGHGAPAPTAGERDLRERRRRVGLGLERGPAVALDRLQGQVARGRGARELGERGEQTSLTNAGSGQQLCYAQRRQRQRAGLVDADRVHRGQRLDRVQLLGEHAAPRHAHGRRRVGEADEHDEPLGHQAHDTGRRGRHGGLGLHVAVVERVAEDRAETDDEHDQRVQQAVDGALERRARMAERARLSRDLRGEAVGADGGDLVGARALDHERPRAQLVAGRAPDGL